MTQRVKLWAAFLAFGMLLSVAGCTYEGTAEDPAQALTTAPGKPTVLRIGTQDDGQVPTRYQIEEFARQVEERSGGRLVIEPEFRAGGDEVRAWDQLVARRVITGDLEMAVIPARAWDTEGVMSFRALSAPFLLTSNEVIREVVKPQLADGMLAGLKSLGLSGLALFPEGRRVFFSFNSPILAPADVRGMVIRAPLSATTYASLRALGAVPADLAEDEFGNEVGAGTTGGAESSLAYATNLPSALTKTGRSIATGNLVLYSKINTLVINAKAMAALSDEDKQVLHDAAAYTRDWASALLSALPVEARKYCEENGKVVTVSAEQLDAFRQATSPVYAELEQDPETKALIAKLRDLAAKAPAEAAVEPCDYDTY